MIRSPPGIIHLQKRIISAPTRFAFIAKMIHSDWRTYTRGKRREPDGGKSLDGGTYTRGKRREPDGGKSLDGGTYTRGKRREQKDSDYKTLTINPFAGKERRHTFRFTGATRYRANSPEGQEAKKNGRLGASIVFLSNRHIYSGQRRKADALNCK
jgi:hypothetical protein